MHAITSPTGERFDIPATAAEDPSGFAFDDPAAVDYYRENGYVLYRNLIGAELCEHVMQEFRRTVMPYDGFIYRQTNAKPERNQIRDGFVMNPILNIQDLPTDHFSAYKQACLNVFTAAKMQKVAAELLDDRPKLVQSMHFHGNSATWAHQDTYYLDSEHIGAMCGAWIALEEIQPGAGRFFVYPKSHRIDVAKHGGNFDIAFHHDRYKALIIDIIRDEGLECCAPWMDTGDVLFWNSKTIHGSLETNQSGCSRASLTCHLIPEADNFLQFQTRNKRLYLSEINGMKINKPKDQDQLKNRAMLYVESHFPRTFDLAKRTAIKVLTH